jgi:hypothetical protein
MSESEEGAVYGKDPIVSDNPPTAQEQIAKADWGEHDGPNTGAEPAEPEEPAAPEEPAPTE